MCLRRKYEIKEAMLCCVEEKYENRGNVGPNMGYMHSLNIRRRGCCKERK